MTDDIVTRLRELPKWQREIVESKRQMVRFEQLQLNDSRRTKRLFRFWWAVRGE